MDYHPYGTERIRLGDTQDQRQYAGTERDQESDLDYMINRYYSSTNGQFLSQDPVFQSVGDTPRLENLASLAQDAILADPQQQNSYAYGRNNPVRFKDPKGLYIETGFDAAMLGVSVYQFAKEPSWTNAGAVALDAGAVILPVPAVGGMALRASHVSSDAASQIARNREAGMAFEQASGYVKNNQHIPSITGTAKYRIPDIYNPAQKEIGDFKNVKYLSLTSQMRDLTSFAKQNDLSFTLVTGPATKISQPLANVLSQLQTTLKQLDVIIGNLKKK